jgi:hypothetical protein
MGVPPQLNVIITVRKSSREVVFFFGSGAPPGGPPPSKVLSHLMTLLMSGEYGTGLDGSGLLLGPSSRVARAMAVRSGYETDRLFREKKSLKQRRSPTSNNHMVNDIDRKVGTLHCEANSSQTRYTPVSIRTQVESGSSRELTGVPDSGHPSHRNIRQWISRTATTKNRLPGARSQGNGAVAGVDVYGPGGRLRH